uniref:Uncharacterized protein TCIL3000_11_10780 n=1 Tax=Trypanosoma congolense (strain IL3000) TaxID=1068625 RepID=G0V1T0_TRYCI|nr:unnamed protein product [Trypanosoma congolense IL3000]
MCDEFLGDLFEEELEKLGKAAFIAGIASFLLKQVVVARSLLRGDPVQNGISAYLPQGYDRSVVAARVGQQLTKSLMVKSLGIGEVKEQLRRAANRDEKVSAFSELFGLTLAGILSGAYVHSLSIMLHVMKHTMCVLVFVLGKQRASSGSGRTGSSLYSKLRSWWNSGTQHFMMQSLLESLGQQMEATPFYFLRDDERTKADDVRQGFCVDALLEIAVPQIVEAAIDVVKTTLKFRDPQMFSVTGCVSENDVHELMQELSVKFLSSGVLPEWTTLLPCSIGDGHSGVLNIYSSLGYSSEDGATPVNGAGAKAAQLTEDDSVARGERGSEGAMLLNGGNHTEVRDLFQVQASSLPLPTAGTEPCSGAALHEELLNQERVLQQQTATFFREFIQSASFRELCVAHTEELLVVAVAACTDFSSLCSGESAPSSVRVPQVLTLVEKQRLRLFDGDFHVQPYVRLLCEETIRATCRGV